MSNSIASKQKKKTFSLCPYLYQNNVMFHATWQTYMCVYSLKVKDVRINEQNGENTVLF